jgi:hypothetical protein
MRRKRSIFAVFLFIGRPKGRIGRSPSCPAAGCFGLVLLMNLLAAHIKRFHLSRKKIGIILIHAGLILLLGGQFLTEVFQVEGQMRLEPGDTKNYSESGRKNELAVIDTTDPDKDRVVAIPESLLAKGGEIRTPELPFRFAVEKYFPNSAPAGPMTGGGKNQGDRRHWPERCPSARPITRSMDTVDFRRRWFKPFRTKGRLANGLFRPGSRAIPLSSNCRNIGGIMPEVKVAAPQTFTFNGRTYEIALRPVRYYNPYSIKLLAFNHDRYPGTDVPKNFSSRIHLNDPSHRR